MLKISFKFICLLFTVIVLSIWLNYLNPIEKIKIKNALYNDVEIINVDGHSFRDIKKNYHWILLGIAVGIVLYLIDKYIF